MTDKEIIQHLQSTKPDKGLTKLYQYFPTVKRLITQNGGNTSDAEDIFQDALLALLTKANQPQFEISASLNTYLFSICKYMWKQKLQMRKKSLSIIYEVELDDSAEETMIQLLEEQQKTIAATKALDALGKRCWEIVKAFYYDGLTMQSIAQKFDFASEKVAKNQKYKCLEKARNQLATVKIAHN